MGFKNIEFSKLQASGNDFILIDRRRKPKGVKENYKLWAKTLCCRKINLGADGLLVIESSKKASFKMRIFNADGSEAEMCGNGARCVALWAKQNLKNVNGNKKNIEFETKAGIIQTRINNPGSDLSVVVGVKMTDPFGLEMNLPIKVFGRKISVNFMDTGVPQVVVFVNSLETVNVDSIGREIRLHRCFHPKGANVNFVEVVSNNLVKVRTYERGVEAETLACGTGAVASAIALCCKLGIKKSIYKTKILTTNKDTVNVDFNLCNDKINNVWLEGKSYFVCKGQIRVIYS